MSASRRLATLLFALLLLPLLGAAPESGLPAPTVVVYPLTSSGANGVEIGSNVAIVLATKLADLGGLSLKPYTPGTARPSYLDAARKEGADYYITGFMTPVGAEVSLVVQVVSTSSGSIVYSATTMARTYADAANQADVLRDAIVRHAGRGLPALSAPPPAPGGSPVPSASDAGGVNLTKALGRKRRAAPPVQPSAAPSPAQAAAATAPASAAPASSAQPSGAASASSARGRKGTPIVAAAGAAAPSGRRLVVQVGGPAAADARSYASGALAAALRRTGAQSGILAITTEDAAAHVADLCRANPGTQALYAGTLALEAASKGASNAVLDLTAYDCNGSPVLRRHAVAATQGRRNPIQAAIDRAATEATRGL